MVVTPEQRARIRIAYGTPDSNVYSDALFGPRTSTADVDRFIDDLNETAKPYVLELVARMERIQQLQGDAAEDAAVSRLGQLQLNPEAFDVLESQYNTWRSKLREAMNPAFARIAGGDSSFNGRWSR